MRIVNLDEKFRFFRFFQTMHEISFYAERKRIPRSRYAGIQSSHPTFPEQEEDGRARIPFCEQPVEEAHIFCSPTTPSLCGGRRSGGPLGYTENAVETLF
jgi:hypothetical protein